VTCAVARAYNGDLEAETSAGVQRAGPGGDRGRNPPKAKKMFPFANHAEAANVSYFLFICSIFARACMD